MAIRRSPIKVSCENEDLPDIENAPDFDEDTLRSELCWASASVIVRTFSIPPVLRGCIINCMTDFKRYLASHDSLLRLRYAVHLEDL